MSDADVRRGREGSRWYNQRPTAEEVAEWFYTVPLHDGMLAADYVSGITLIPAKEKSDEVVGWDSNGLPQIRERQDLVFIPYVKVDTRVAYFWRLMEDRDWVGAIEPIIAPNTENLGLPPGFFKYAAADPKGKTVSFVGCSMRITIADAEGKTVRTPPPGTKIVSTATRWDVDQNSIMKAETGAIGRALGMAGMLVVPGSGVATAEDMADSSVAAGAAGEPSLPTTTGEPTTDEELRERATELVEQLGQADPAKLELFQAWARARSLTLENAQGPVLKGAVKKLEKTVAELDGATAHA
jgi:hypothetical protein